MHSSESFASTPDAGDAPTAAWWDDETPPAPIATDDDSFSYRVLLDGLKLCVESQSFRGGHVAAALSGVTLDLRAATLAPEGATLDLHAALSGVDILVPPDWQVHCDVSAICSGIDEGSQRTRPKSGGPRLRITGTVVAGGLFVR